MRFFFFNHCTTIFGGSSTNQVFAPHFLLCSHLFLSDGNKINQRCCCKTKAKDYSLMKKKKRFQMHSYIQFETLLEKNI